ncbi:aminotransferase class I/II-fold pyridoxal phosphate-dependent enzyme [Patescibacteria group bacterium]
MNVYKAIVKSSIKRKFNMIRGFEGIDELQNIIDKSGVYPDMHIYEGSGVDPIDSENGKELLFFSSNNYLGLSKNPDIIDATIKSIRQHGIGPGGSRLLSGNIKILTELDGKVAELVGKEDAITFPTGYMANLAIFRALFNEFMFGLPAKCDDSIIFSDEYNHSTVVDGIRLSRVRVEVFKHNDMNHLEELIKENKKYKHKLIVTEGAFSLEGHTAPLDKVVDIAENYGCQTMIDDAHGIGVLGECGGGVVEDYGVADRIDIIMGSFDKALGGMGGFLAGNAQLIKFLRVAARPYVFSSSIPAMMAGGIIKAIDICRNDDKHKKQLFENANYLRERLRQIGFNVLGDGTFPVIPVLIGNDKISIEMERKLYEKGVSVANFRWPAVKKNTARFRITPMATHTKDQIDQLITVFEQTGKELKIIN